MTIQKEPGGSGGLGRVAVVGSALQMAGRGLRALVGVATVTVMARFLSPADFGAFALIYAIIILAQVFADLGLRVALVQRAEISDIECQSVFWTSTVAGIAIAGLIFLLADPIARLFGSPEISPYIRMISPVFIVIGLRGVPMALLERRFMFKQIAATDLAAAIIGSVTAVAFAAAGSTVGALVAQQLAMVVALAALLFYHARWLPRLQFSRDALSPLARYGSFVTLSGLLYAVTQMIERPLIGSRLSTTDLGYLTMSDQIVMTPVRIIATNVSRVTFPLFSSIQNDNVRLANAHCRSLHALTLVLAPCLFGLAALAEPFSILLLGPSWAPVATLMAITSVRALLVSVGDINYAIFASKGEARFQFNWNIFSLVVTVVALLASIPFGIEAVVASKLLVSLVLLLPLQSWFLARLLGTSVLAFLAPMVRPTLAAIFMAAAVYAVDALLEARGLSLLQRLVAGPALGVPLYAGLILLIDRKEALALVERFRIGRAHRKA